MKRSAKITLWVVGVLVGTMAIVHLSADIIVSRIVQNKVHEALIDIPDVDVIVGDIYLDVLSGSVIVKDITFCTHSLTMEDPDTERRAPGLAFHLPTLAVLNVGYLELLRDHELKITKVSLDDPQLILYIDEKHPEAILPTLPKDTTLEKAAIWLTELELKKVEINDFVARIHSTTSPLQLAIDSLSTTWRDIEYSFEDSTFSYNDSVYAFTLNSLKAQLPDGLFEMEVHDINHSDQGSLSVGYTHLLNTVSPSQLADIRQEQSAWIDMELSSVTTSPFNPIRKALAQDYTLDAIQVDAKRLHLDVDVRYQPVRHYGTPQDFLMSLPVRFNIKQVSALARKVDIDFSPTLDNHSSMHLTNARAQMSNITNRRGAIWYNTAKVPFGGKGSAEASYHMYMDKHSTFELALKGKDIETEELNSFIRPLVSITTKCHINQLDIAYKGDKQKATGEFCMQYEGMEIHVHKEDKIPYEVITNNAELFEGIANSLIPKSNPGGLDAHPRRYYIQWKRDEMKPYPLYLFGPCIDGIKMTMLPGLYVHKLVDPNKAKKTK